jgi:hypothetical protein
VSESSANEGLAWAWRADSRIAPAIATPGSSATPFTHSTVAGSASSPSPVGTTRAARSNAAESARCAASSTTIDDLRVPGAPHRAPASAAPAASRAITRSSNNGRSLGLA